MVKLPTSIDYRTLRKNSHEFAIFIECARYFVYFEAFSLTIPLPLPRHLFDPIFHTELESS